MRKITEMAVGRMSLFLLGVLVVIPAGGNAGDASGARPEIAWEEIADALSALPSMPTKPHRGYYNVAGKDKKEAERRLDKLKAKGDIVPAIVRGLDRFKAGTDDGERHIFNLVTVLKENPDERALAALDRIAQSTPTVRFRPAWLDGAEQPVYVFNQLAKETAERIRVDKAAKEWNRGLAGKSPTQRREELASFYWSPAKVDYHKRRGAGTLLNTGFKPEERLEEIEKRLGAVIDAGTPWRREITVHMIEELRRLAQQGASKERVVALLEKVVAEAGDAEVRRYAQLIRGQL